MAGEPQPAGPPVAIVGIGCRFPGGADDARSFWQLLSEGRNAVGEIPSDRIDLSRFFDARPATPGRMMSRWGGFLDQVDMFDAAFFGISPREAERMDPQQRLVLETAWEALEDAGQDIAHLSGGQTGVFLGQWLSDFEGRLFSNPADVDFYMTTGSGRYATSGRLSYLLGLQGPSITIDTACSSSLVAVHLAVRSLRDGECELALAGGVNVILQPHISVAYSQSRMMAPDGRCKFGDASGDGYVRSEGAGIVALKRLDRAVADGDRVYAVIRGSAVNNDGRSSGSMGTPSRIGQEALLRSALRDAGVAPARVGYIEAHGTGTRAGDPVELGALGAVLGEGRAPGERALVGSVKTNIGHTEGAAGVAGLIKAALALYHRSVPASLHCREPNPAVAWDDAPFALANQTQPWSDGAAPRVAGVSAFGIAGTNAHVVLEEAPAATPATPHAASAEPETMALLPLSARSAESLRALATRYADRLSDDASAPLNEWCANAAAYRSSLDHRAAFVASTAGGMADALREFARGESIAAPAVPDGPAPRVVFVVPGQGAQWLGMGRELMATQPAFRAALQQCDDAAKPHVAWSVVEQLQLACDAPGYQLDRIDVIQPVLVALAIAYAALWRSKGVEPDAVVGHSMGEVAAAAIAGVLDLDQAMRVVCRRSALMRRTSGQGAMALVELSMDDARDRLRGREAELSVAVSNSPRSSVISGEPKAVAEVMAALERDGVFCRLVKVDVASHSPQMAPLAAELETELAALMPHAGGLPIYSTVLARRAEGCEFDASYWARNLRQPVMFAQTIGQLVADGFTVFVELGPHPVLLPAVEQTAQSLGVAATTIGCGRRDEPEQRSFLDAAAALWTSGAHIDWSRFMPAPRVRVPLPLYAWQRERHWVDAANIDAGEPLRRRVGLPRLAPSHPLLGTPTILAGTPSGWLWEPDLDVRHAPFLGEHRLHGLAVLPASVYVELALAAARAAGGEPQVEALAFEQVLHLPADTTPLVQMQAAPAGAALALTWHGGSPTGWIRHASARLPMHASGGKPLTSFMAGIAADISALRGGPAFPASAFYERLQSLGADFAGSLRGVSHIWLAVDRAFAEIAAPNVDGPSWERFAFAPATLDACFQVAVTCAAGQGGAIWLPTGIERVHRVRSAPAPSGVHVRLHGDGDDRHADVTLLDEQGPLLRLEGVRLQRLAAGSQPQNLAPRLFQTCWRAAPLTTPPAVARRWLLLADRGGIAEALAARWREAGADVDLVPADIPLDTLVASPGRAARLDLVYLRGLDLDAAPGAHTGGDLQGFVQALHRLNSFDAAVRRGWLVTRSAWAVEPDDEPNPVQAMLWGLSRAQAEEHQGAWGGCIDLPADDDVAAQAARLGELLLADAQGDSAWRAGERLVPQWTAFAAAPTRRAFALRPDATCLITGGLGGVGFQVARWLIERGARRLVILGRTDPGPRAGWTALDAGSARRRAAEAIRALEALGATVHLAVVDVADESTLRRFLDGFAAEGWPPIRAVFHAAGVTDDRLLGDIDADSLQRVLAGKVLGAFHLDRLLPSLDHFVLFSSVAATLTQAGQGSYAAANAFLDALAHRRRRGGQPALSVDWGVWQGVGFAGTEGGAQAAGRLAQRGVAGFGVEGGLAALGVLLESDLTQAAVFALDAAALREALASHSLTPAGATLLAPLAEPAAGEAAPAAPADAAEDFVDHLTRHAGDERSRLLQERLVQHACAVLHLSPDRLDRRSPLGSHGLGSLMALEMRNRIERDLKLPLSATVMWNYPTIAALTEHLLARIAPEPSASATKHADRPAAIAPTPARAAAVIEALSDDDALAAFARAPRTRRSL